MRTCDDARQLLSRLASIITAVDCGHPVRVAVDGVDAAGKTTLAEEAATLIRAAGRPVIRASVDDFHNPRAIRYQRGADSPEGYFRDSFNYAALRHHLLDPLGPNGCLRYVPAVFDWRTDSEVRVPVREAPPDSVLVLDGVFLLRPELDGSWDLTIWVDAAFDVTVARAETRARQDGSGVLGLRERYQRRYVPGQMLYLSEAQPSRRADLVVDNNDFANPRLLDQRATA